MPADKNIDVRVDQADINQSQLAVHQHLLRTRGYVAFCDTICNAKPVEASNRIIGIRRRIITHGEPCFPGPHIPTSTVYECGIGHNECVVLQIYRKHQEK